MGGKKGGADGGSKKAMGQARKADAASQKAAAADAERENAEGAKWDKGAKNSNKKEAEAEKKAELARKKAEREAMLAEEEKNTPGRSAPKNAKTAVKKTRGLDLSQLDNDGGGGGLGALSASGIDNALDALSLTAQPDNKIDKHPERRFKAAYAAFEERRLTEMDTDGSGAGLRQNQKKERLRKEFERSPENPFNQVSARYDATKEELAEMRDAEKSKIEKRLGSK